MASFGELFWSSGENGVGAWWLPHVDDPTDPDSWQAPVSVTSTRFRQLLHQHFPGLAPTKRRCKEPVEALEARAYTGRKVEEVGWTAVDGRGQCTTIRVALSAGLVAVVDAHQPIRVEQNGQHALFRMPPGFAPLRWHKLMAAAGQVPVPAALENVRRAITDHLPPPAFDAAVTDEEQAALVLGWWAGLIVEPVCRGRPMLALLGEKGSGKTLTAELLGTLYYGDKFRVGGGVGGGRMIKDLVASMVAKPLTVSDDMTNVPREVVDTLCRLATGSDVELAKMHETMAYESYRARAATVITSARPAWALRDDLLSRIIPVRIGTPPPSPYTDDDRKQRVLDHRDAAWVEILLSLQVALRETPRELSKTRFPDWETRVRRIAQAGGWADVFTRALGKLDKQRVTMATSSDLLVSALYAVATEHAGQDWYWTIHELYDATMAKMGAIIAESHFHRPSGRLPRIQDFSKFFRAIEDKGSVAVSLHRGHPRDGAETWTLRPKA